MKKGENMYLLAKRMWPICRSITGNGVRDTLKLLKQEFNELKLYEVPTGTKVFDWQIPKEWNIKDAFIKNSNGDKLIDFNKNNLHVVGYSLPIDRKVDLNELKKYIFTEPMQPDAIPYVTSYYKERSGFCMSEKMKKSLEEDTYHIYIDSELKDGSMTYGEIILKGRTEREIFISTYICHPSMANNELSGPCVTIELAKWISKIKDRRYTYRIVFIPETIGSITYISKNINEMKKNIDAGFNITCVGDNKTFSFIPSRYGNTLADKVSQNILSFYYPDYKKYTYLERGSDERQYCSPGVDLPLCTICRSKYGEYPEYHTSLDNLDFISPDGLEGALEVYKQCIVALENNYYYKNNYLCEPQLGKRGLYPTISQKGTANTVRDMMNFIAYADGTNDLIDISNLINVPCIELVPIINRLIDKEVIIK